MVSFSSASFALSEVSVVVALQCCPGGDREGFRVVELSDRRFRFSVASNKVGHYVYSLKDRVWPDFVCHFHLFRGGHSVHSRSVGWHADCENLKVSARSKTALRTNLDFLKASAVGDSSSAGELMKFGLAVNSGNSRSQLQFGSFSVPAITAGSLSNSNTGQIRFGQFVCPRSSDSAVSGLPRFVGLSYRQDLFSSLPKETLLGIMDERDVGLF